MSRQFTNCTHPSTGVLPEPDLWEGPRAGHAALVFQVSDFGSIPPSSEGDWLGKGTCYACAMSFVRGSGDLQKSKGDMGSCRSLAPPLHGPGLSFQEDYLMRKQIDFPFPRVVVQACQPQKVMRKAALAPQNVRPTRDKGPKADDFNPPSHMFWGCWTFYRVCL